MIIHLVCDFPWSDEFGAIIIRIDDETERNFR